MGNKNYIRVCRAFVVGLPVQDRSALTSLEMATKVQVIIPLLAIAALRRTV